MPDFTVTRGDQTQLAIATTLTNAQMTGGGATATFTAKWRLDDTTAALSYTVGAGLVIDTTGATPTLRVTILNAATANFPAEKVGLFWDAEASPNDGTGPITASSGRLYVYPDVF